MNRRAFLVSAPTVAFAGCATRLGLADRVEIVEKVVQASDGSARDELAVRRFDPDEGPYYDGEIREPLAPEIGTDDPLVVSEALASELDGQFETVRFAVRGCGESLAGPGEAEGCRAAPVVRSDFNEVEVGDVVDVRYGDASAGVISVHRRRENRD
ncbi:hypothetical protein [Salinilacihabitans rarus]|uniref:hypothetical protein n=1 Tax=Salinilacihabitans rarus TaxID=2961596 RepID=UPI0020C8FFD2|nr:hypothetical protein [Salinilacihabitans rarus]